MRQGMPFVQLKLAMSLDGRTAMASGESKWITGPDARSDVQKCEQNHPHFYLLPQQSLQMIQALMYAGTNFLKILKQNIKKEWLRQPVRVILDSQHRIQPTHKLFFNPFSRLVSL